MGTESVPKVEKRKKLSEMMKQKEVSFKNSDGHDVTFHVGEKMEFCKAMLEVASVDKSKGTVTLKAQ